MSIGVDTYGPRPSVSTRHQGLWVVLSFVGVGVIFEFLLRCTVYSLPFRPKGRVYSFVRLGNKGNLIVKEGSLNMYLYQG